MARIVYVNGKFVPEDQAMVSIFDRGFLFADAVYEVTTVIDGKLVDFQAHMARLSRSLGEISLTFDYTADDILAMHRRLVEENDLTEGMIYLQVSRGPADRDFAFPASPEPSCVAFTQAMPVIDREKSRKGISVVCLPDIRWKRCDIKTVSLLAASLCKEEAIRRGADDAWLTTDGFVTEGTSNNAFIVTRDDEVITRSLGNDILPGITRQALLDLAAACEISIIERPFSVQEAHQAAEAFITSATAFVTPVVKIDEYEVGSGTPGNLTLKLRELYIDRARATAI